MLSSLTLLILLSRSVHPNPGPRKLNMLIAHLTINIADNKLSEIAAIADTRVLAFSETWLNPNICNNSVLIPGYQPLEEIAR